MVYNRYDSMHADLRKLQLELESKFLNEQDVTEKEALALYNESPEKVAQYLTTYSQNQAQHAFEKWKKLGEFLVVKYIDGGIKKEENGVFTKGKLGEPIYPQRPGYSKEYYKEVVKQTGDKYKVLY